MAVAAAQLNLRPLIWLQQNRGLVFPIIIVALIMVIVVPLPTPIMDVLLAANLTLAAVVLLTTVYVTSPLEFSVFPSLLLATTLVRLVLNVATTRLILTAGARSGSPEEAMGAAGNVIQTFGNFVASGSLAVGLIIFLILIIIQFVVITKGATRISEVAARFTLDGMPGKQMAIDADLNAGLINENDARSRREAISREADFYGAMDGASKFVRGDAIAGIIITLINIVGGLYVGMVEFGWDITSCLQTFTKLTIGDGLVSQIPAFIISLAAGLIVTRSTGKTNLGEELVSQLTSKPKALFVAGGFLAVLAFTELPFVPLLVLGSGVGGLAFTVTRSQKREIKQQTEAHAKATRKPERIESLLAVDPMELEVGFGLIKMVDAGQGGDLLERINLIRKQVAGDLGIVVPPIRIRDNVQLASDEYRIKIKGIEIEGGTAMADHYLAMDSGMAEGQLNGVPTTEPAFGMPATWITEEHKADAELMNYTVVEASGVVATHLTEVIRSQGAELLTRQQVKHLVETLKEKAPAVVEEVVPEKLKLGEVQKVLQNLLRERVPIRDLETILEVLGEWSPRSNDTDVLTEYCRNGLARTICASYRNDDGKIYCITLDPALEDLVNSHVERGESGALLTMPPVLAGKIADAVAQQIEILVSAGHHPVVLTSPQVRMQLRRLLEGSLPNVAVLAFNEVIKGVSVESMAMVTVQQ